MINRKECADMSNKFDDFLSAIKIGELMHKKNPIEKRKIPLFVYSQ